MTILTRLGNKRKLADDITAHFPKEIDLFIDLFMGSGSITFKMINKVKHVIANDIDSDVFNLFMVVKDHREQLREAIEKMPIHEDLFKHWMKNKEEDKILKAIRFLMLSNFSLYGTQSTMKIDMGNTKRIILERLDETFKMVQNVKFTNTDFRTILKKISIRKGFTIRKAFIYADPPYLGTSSKGYAQGFKLKDTEDLFAMLIASKMLFAVSEFDNPVVLKLASKYNLKVVSIKERQNIKNRKKEILIKNY